MLINGTEKFSHCKDRNTIRSPYYIKVNSKYIKKNLKIKYKMKKETVRVSGKDFLNKGCRSGPLGNRL